MEEIDFAAVHKELKARKHLTLQRVWQEYREQHPDGYSYSQYCERYRQWKSRQNLVMLQEHKAGEHLFVDYAGRTVPIDDELSGELCEAVIFVAVLGALFRARNNEEYFLDRRRGIAAAVSKKSDLIPYDMHPA